MLFPPSPRFARKIIVYPSVTPHSAHCKCRLLPLPKSIDSNKETQRDTLELLQQEQWWRKMYFVFIIDAAEKARLIVPLCFFPPSRWFARKIIVHPSVTPHSAHCKCRLLPLPKSIDSNKETQRDTLELLQQQQQKNVLFLHHWCSWKRKSVFPWIVFAG